MGFLWKSYNFIDLEVLRTLIYWVILFMKLTYPLFDDITFNLAVFCLGYYACITLICISLNKWIVNLLKMGVLRGKILFCLLWNRGTFILVIAKIKQEIISVHYWCFIYLYFVKAIKMLVSARLCNKRLYRSIRLNGFQVCGPE